MELAATIPTRTAEEGKRWLLGAEQPEEDNGDDAGAGELEDRMDQALAVVQDGEVHVSGVSLSAVGAVVGGGYESSLACLPTPARLRELLGGSCADGEGWTYTASGAGYAKILVGVRVQESVPAGTSPGAPKCHETEPWGHVFGYLHNTQGSCQTQHTAGEYEIMALVEQLEGYLAMHPELDMARASIHVYGYEWVWID